MSLGLPFRNRYSDTQVFIKEWESMDMKEKAAWGYNFEKYLITQKEKRNGKR